MARSPGGWYFIKMEAQMGFSHAAHLRRTSFVLAMALLTLLCAPLARAQNATPGDSALEAEAVSATSEADPAAEGEALAEGAADAENMPADLSVWGMFMAAGLVAKAVMLLLVVASAWNFMVMFEKSVVLRRVNRQADRFLEIFRGAKSLSDLSREALAGAKGPMARMFVAGMQEFRATADWGIAIDGELRDRVSERVARAMAIAQSHETRELGGSMSLLATIGATAPFIGLFGTVWGIMTSFIGIAQSGTTNLAVVAPGIAEALLATAIGLAAAIPAVMLYNKFARQISRFSGRLEDFSGEFAVVLSRELDQRGTV
jgi:TolQ protein